MKQNIHPQYFRNAIFKCACGHTWTGGGTSPEVSVEICGNCHPLYTGKEKLVDTRGRIEKFTKRSQRHQEAAKTRIPKKPRLKKNIAK